MKNYSSRNKSYTYKRSKSVIVYGNQEKYKYKEKIAKYFDLKNIIENHKSTLTDIPMYDHLVLSENDYSNKESRKIWNFRDLKEIVK